MTVGRGNIIDLFKDPWIVGIKTQKFQNMILIFNFYLLSQTEPGKLLKILEDLNGSGRDNKTLLLQFPYVTSTMKSSKVSML